MDDGPKNVNRQVVPRWRQLARTRPQELASTSKPDESWLRSLRTAQDRDARRAHDRWIESPTVETASELVAAALFTRQEAMALGAANQLLAPNSSATAAVREVARRLKAGRPFRGVDLEQMPVDPDQQKLVTTRNLASIKRRLIEYPLNPLLQVEAARLYSTLGQQRKSTALMERAIAIAPRNRFVLRSAARLFVHEEDPRRAHDLLRRNEDTSRDPWLLAAEIAVSDVAERKSLFLPAARSLLKAGSFADIQVSELAAALGTVEMLNGSNKAARKLFQLSLSDPTDNSVAQVRWASGRIGMVFDEKYLREQGAFEARAEAAYFGNSSGAQIIEHAVNWWHDEPFSARPMMLASFIASTRLQDHELSLKFVDAALVANKSNVGLINNRVVALINLGRIDEAEKEMGKLVGVETDDVPIIQATKGLLLFRRGNVDAGRMYYRDAIRIAHDSENISTEVRAKAHLLEEEVLSGNLAALDELRLLRGEFEKTRNAALYEFWNSFSAHLQAILFNKMIYTGNLPINQASALTVSNDILLPGQIA